MTETFKHLITPLCLSLVIACSNQTVYDDESFAEDSPFRQKVDGAPEDVCESARRSLLGQGYLIETATGEELKARKAATGGDSQNTFIEMNIVCLPESTGSTLFATGLLSEYSLKKNSSSASVGVSALGSISLPIGQSADSLVKVSEETIDNKEFYQRFFAAVSTILADMQAGKPKVYPAESVEMAPVAPSQLEPEALEAKSMETELVGSQDPSATTDPEPVHLESAMEPLPNDERPFEESPVISPDTVDTDELPEMTIEQILALESEPPSEREAPAAKSQVPDPAPEGSPTVPKEPEPTARTESTETYSEDLDELF